MNLRKRQLFALTLLVIIATISAEVFSFEAPRGLFWGMTPEQAKDQLQSECKKIKYDSDYPFERIAEVNFEVFKTKTEFNNKKRTWFLGFNNKALEFLLIKLDDVLLGEKEGGPLEADLRASYKIQEIGEIITAKYEIRPEAVKHTRVDETVSTIDELIWSDSTTNKIRLFYSKLDAMGINLRKIYIIYGNEENFTEAQKNQLKDEKKSKDF